MFIVTCINSYLWTNGKYSTITVDPSREAMLPFVFGGRITQLESKVTGRNVVGNILKRNTPISDLTWLPSFWPSSYRGCFALSTLSLPSFKSCTPETVCWNRFTLGYHHILPESYFLTSNGRFKAKKRRGRGILWWNCRYLQQDGEDDWICIFSRIWTLCHIDSH